MHKLEKKFIVILVSLAFLMSGIATTSAITIQKNETGELEEASSEMAPLTKTVTLYRYGIGGSVTPFEVNINLEDGQDIGKAMADKCEELLENDEEIQNFLKEWNYNGGVLCKVKSTGKGFHYQTLLIEKLLVRFLLFKLDLPRIHTILNKPLVLCKYKNPEAETTITPLLINATKYTRNMTGKHMVACINFLGFTSWLRRFSFSPFNIIPRSFSGVSVLVICKRL